MRVRGTMLWFNSDKDLGALQPAKASGCTLREAFVPGEKPVGRCAGLEIEFDSRGTDVNEIAFVHELSPRRARRGHRR